MLKKNKFDAEKITDLQIWLVIFTITLLIILLVQLIILPFIFPSWHAGNGLLTAGDWIGFHQEAVELSQRINNQGWSAWELRPKGWFPAGVAGAIYALTWPVPWVLAPINAAVHAFTGLIVLKILNIFTRRKDIDLVAVIPFLFFPSAMILYTQIHRDSYNILGMLLFIYGLLLIARLPEEQLKTKYLEIIGFVTSFLGIALLWMSRPHTLLMFFYAGLLLLLFSVLFFSVMVLKKSLHWKNALSKLLLFALIISLIIPFTKTDGAGKYLREFSYYNHTYKIFLSSPETQEPQLWASTAGVTGLHTPLEEQDEGTIIKEEDFIWTKTPFLPSRIDDHFRIIALTRSVWFPISYGPTAINIDRDVVFSSAIDFVYYLPRALQIAYLAPFPNDWFGEGRRETTTFLRRISALEMIIIYFFTLPMILSIWIWRKKIEIYLLFIFCTVMMMPIIYSTPNLGTLYRYRYGYLMLLICLGVAVFCQFVKGKIAKKLLTQSPTV